MDVLKKEWAKTAQALAALAEVGTRQEVRAAVVDLLLPSYGGFGAFFQTFGPDALSDSATVTRGVGGPLLERLASTWARQLAEIAGTPLDGIRTLGVARLDDVPWGSGSGRRTRTWKEVFAPLGVGDTLGAWIEVPHEAPRLLVFLRRKRERFEPWERDSLAYLLPYLALVERTSRRATRNAGDALTARQLEIVEHLRNGRTNAEIAERLGISENTVRNQLARAYRRYDVKSRTALLARVGTKPARKR